MTQCPFCETAASRTGVHSHMVDEHVDRVETWKDARSGRMHYRVECPSCGDVYEHRVKPRSSDPGFLERFAREISMVAFDMLLNHVEAAHEQPAPGEALEREELPAYGSGGGSGRPGQHGIPVPPGMPAPEPPTIPGHPRPSSPQIVQHTGRERGMERPDKVPHEGEEAD